MKNKLDQDLDELFQIPLSDFIGARNALASRLKKAGRADEANLVKTIAKPSVSVWTVNQLYWRHRDEFDQLISAGQRFRRAHTTRTAKASELTGALGARREALDRLSTLAANLLRQAGHNPTLETMRRIATTLEAMSAYAALPDDQAAGRLTVDLDPPGFESLAPFIRAVPTTRRVEAAPQVRGSSPTLKEGAVHREQARSGSTHARPDSPTIKATRNEDKHRARLATAKATLINAKKSLVEARTKAQSLAAAQKKAEAEVKIAEQQKREAEQRFKQASTASAESSVRAQNLAREAERAARTLADAERAVERAANELDSLA